MNHSTRRFLVIFSALISFGQGLSTGALGEPEDPVKSAAQGWVHQQMNAISSVHKPSEDDLAAIAMARAEMKCLTWELAQTLVQPEIDALERILAEGFDPEAFDPFAHELLKVYRARGDLEARLRFIVAEDPRIVVMREDAALVASAILAAASLHGDRETQRPIIFVQQSGCGGSLSAFALSVDLTYRLSIEIILDAVEARIASKPELLPPGVGRQAALSAVQQIRANYKPSSTNHPAGVSVWPRFGDLDDTDPGSTDVAVLFSATVGGSRLSQAR